MGTWGPMCSVVGMVHGRTQLWCDVEAPETLGEVCVLCELCEIQRIT